MTDLGWCGASLVCDDDSVTSFVANFGEDDPIDWDMLLRNPKCQQVTVASLLEESTTNRHHLLELGLAVRSNPNITRLFFEDSAIEDIAPLCVAFAGRYPLVTIDFVRCDLGPRSVQSIVHLLERNLIGALLLADCEELGNDEMNIITTGLEMNQSLKIFGCTTWRCEPLSSVNFTSLQNFAANNKNLVELRLRIEKSTSYWDLFRAVEKQDTLQSLQISQSNLNIESMEALVTICLTLRSLKKLNLRDCRCEKNALEFLARTLSKFNAVDTLIFDFVHCIRPFEFDVNFGNVQVKKLVFCDTDIGDEPFSLMLESIANNPFIDTLEVTNVNEQDLRRVSEILLLRNVGPTELVIDNGRGFGNLISEAMQVNPKLKSLIIDDMEAAELITVAEGLANMPGLCKLSFRKNCAFSKEFFRALLDSMEHNTTLCTLSLENIPKDESARFLPRIHYLLAINRVGRHRLMIDPAPVGLWARVLERSSNEPNGIFFALTENPDLVSY